MKLNQKSLFFACIALLVLIPFAASAGTFTVMTEEYPPYNYTDNGKLTGFATEIVQDLMKRIGHPNNIESLPWSRSYNLIQKKEGHVLYSMTRTEQREDMFKWVGPLAANTWVFFSKKGNDISISSLEDAKKVGKIGTYKDDAAESYLKDNGFTNLNSVIDDDLNPNLLMKGRTDLWITGEIQGIDRLKKLGINPADMEKEFTVKEVQLYIAFSKNTPDSDLAAWQKGLDEMKADGTYEKILSKYK